MPVDYDFLAPDSPDAPPDDPAANPTVRDLLALHNQARTDHGAGPLRLDPRLGKSATEIAADCARTGRLHHTASDGRDPFRRMKDAGYNWTTAGENIAMGQATAAAAVAAWMGDLPHRRNLLNPRFKDVGFGVVQAAGGAFYWAADFGADAAALDAARAAGAVPEMAWTEYPCETAAQAYDPGD